MERLETKLNSNPALKLRFEEQRTQFNRVMQESASALPGTANRVTAVYPIPIVFHIVLANPSVVTDAQIRAQIDTLNKEYSGSNGDSTKIPSYFKSLFGRSGISFCLAQRTPEGESTTGIERITTSKASFNYADDAVKHVSTGGANIWDASKYLNVWICQLSNSIVGYSTFPQDGSEDEQGVAIDYRSLPGGSLTAYNGGKTLVHEAGHYFNLYHIWGDDGGACTGTDYVDDTPNQADATSGCYTGIKTDNCTPSGNGIMYQNFMDYSNDACMVMFTSQQVARMESAIAVYRSSLLSSDACQPAVVRNYDAQIISISQPGQRLCSPLFAPVITIKNKGIQTLSSLVITVKIDDITVANATWNGTLAKSATAVVNLSNLSASTGNHILSIAVSQPNGNPDEEPGDNTSSLAFQYYAPVATLSESFEDTAFPPPGWDIVNSNGVTWQRVTGIAKTGNASVMINNLDNSVTGQKDDLRSPNLILASSLDTAFLSFQVAAATYTAANTAGNTWDTLEVLASTDCGANYVSLYKKWGSSLVTRTTATENAFAPTAAEWRKDSINLNAYIGASNLLIAFRNTNGNENNIYLDDVNLRTVTVNPNLKSSGFLVTPNPTSGAIAVQFYPQPTNLSAIQVYSITGQRITELYTGGNANNYYRFDLSNQASGTYIIRAVFTDRVVVKKIVKY